MQLLIQERNLLLDVEVVEKKGRGHPDTLADGLAEYISNSYSLYTLEQYGHILQHNFDKVGLLGGSSKVSFGIGEIISPIRVLINGRASVCYYDKQIPCNELILDWSKSFLSRELPLASMSSDFVWHFNLSSANTAGYPIDDFAQASTNPHTQREKILASDTAAVCSHYPLSNLEYAVLACEDELSSNSSRKVYPWLGYDIKILAIRKGNVIEVTACIPQISRFVPSFESYKSNIQFVSEWLKRIFRNHLPDFDIRIMINTKDDYLNCSYYLTAIGSCIESGDEGLVGRGNRPCRLIPISRSFSGEAACGKNPVFFPGKLYPVVGRSIAEKLYKITGKPVEIWLISQEGHSLMNPWSTIVIFDGKVDIAEREITPVIEEELARIPEHTIQLINGNIQLY